MQNMVRVHRSVGFLGPRAGDVTHTTNHKNAGVLELIIYCKYTEHSLVPLFERGVFASMISATPLFSQNFVAKCKKAQCSAHISGTHFTNESARNIFM